MTTSVPRLFTQAALPAPGADVALAEPQAHYLGTVMRRRVGDAVLLFNGRDGEWRGRLTALSRGRGTVTLDARSRPQADEPGPWLLFAPVKRDATDLIVRMATELGAEAILPVLTERSNTTRVNEDRLLAIAIEAAEQSERLGVPTLHPPRRLFDVLADWPPTRTLFAAIERSGAPPPCPDGPAALLVGPEGGFAPHELDGLRRSAMVRPVGLGPLVLRAESACASGLALLRLTGNR